MSLINPALPSLEHLLPQLQQEAIAFFPVRHHSPACAWHIQQWIEQHQPAVVLIEGPADLTPLIPAILHPQTKAPFAIYTTYIDTAKRKVVDEPSPGLHHPPRFAGYHPFCDYSPELIALRTGVTVGAQVRFIDLSFPAQTIAAQTETLPQIRSLQAETHWNRSEYIQALAKKTGCRDHDDLWDHLFEANFLKTPTADFMQQVATYCYMARVDTPLALLTADGTLAREQAMAQAIQQTQSTTNGKILVVTGGFHTVVLPQLIQASLPKSKPLKLSSHEAQTVLMRYSFEQLDALNGYAAGMPAPEFYQQVWEQTADHNPLKTAHFFLVQISRHTRHASQLTPLSTADTIAALDHAQRIAQFRQHTIPTREDLLDSIRSCFIKGTADTEGAILMEMVQEVLRGDRIGNVPPDVGIPTIVADFRQRAKQQHLKIQTTVTQSLRLDIYRKISHRRSSQLLHQLAFLDIPFGQRVSGADFIRGTNLDRIQEIWDYRWSPQTESALIERSPLGATIAEAVFYRLEQAITHLETEGKGRSATEAVQILIQACLMGLHQQTSRVLNLISTQIAEDPSFPSLVGALNQLVLLGQSHEPLEAHHLSAIPILTHAAYQRACYLVPDLMACPAEQLEIVLEGFCTIQDLLNSDATLDSALFHLGLEQIVQVATAHPTITGGALGVLYRSEWVTAEVLVHQTVGFLNSSAFNPKVGAGFLCGLFKTCRTAAWTLPALLEAINAGLTIWEDEQFLGILPDLRLAFADLTPRETDQVAAQVAQLHGKPDLGHLWNRQLSEADLQDGLWLEQHILNVVEQDGLGDWIHGSLSL